MQQSSGSSKDGSESTPPPAQSPEPELGHQGAIANGPAAPPAIVEPANDKSSGQLAANYSGTGPELILLLIIISVVIGFLLLSLMSTADKNPIY